MQLRKYQRSRAVLSTIPTASLKLRARAHDLALADGAAVDSWAPLIGPTFTQGTGANQPAFRLNAGPNGRSVVEFDGTADFVGSADATFSALVDGADKPFTCIAVARCTGATGNRVLLSFGNSGSGNNFHESLLALTNQVRIAIRGADGVTHQVASGPILNTTDYHITASRYDGTTGHVYQAGALRASVALNPDSLTGMNQAQIGCLRRNTNSDFFQGFIAEVLFFNADLGHTTTVAIQRTLGAYYALPVS